MIFFWLRGEQKVHHFSHFGLRAIEIRQAWKPYWTPTTKVEEMNGSLQFVVGLTRGGEHNISKAHLVDGCLETLSFPEWALLRDGLQI